jgi:hypothetical protein
LLAQAGQQLTQENQAKAAQAAAQQKTARPNYPDAASRATVEASKSNNVRPLRIRQMPPKPQPDYSWILRKLKQPPLLRLARVAVANTSKLKPRMIWRKPRL